MSDHAHGSGAADRRRLTIVLAVTAVVLAVEVVGAIVSGSLALLADAGHMLTDAAGLTIALAAATMAARPATTRRTWGYLRAEVLAATLQAALLLGVGGFVLVEGIRRLLSPPDVTSSAMLVFGVIGLVGNLIGLFVLSRGPRGTLNLRAAFLEVANDALGSAAVIVAAVVIAATGWSRADAVVSILIAVLIAPRTLRLLRETTEVLLESAPRGLDLDEIRRHLVEVPHVHSVHDLHVSQIASGLPVLTAHVVVDDSCFLDGHAPQMLDHLQACVAGHFPISVEHSTFQLEPAGHARHESAAHA
ncbi:MAG: cation diffusion facilitator family transporter [bacterium]